MVKLEIELEIAEIERKNKEHEKKDTDCKSSPEERVREAIDFVENYDTLSGNRSNPHWIMLCRLYKQLQSVEKPNKRQQNIIEMIDPVLKKYGYYEVVNGRPG